MSEKYHRDGIGLEEEKLTRDSYAGLSSEVQGTREERAVGVFYGSIFERTEKLTGLRRCSR